jgi:FKBP-type peptidyl-prolyl cis-trans isomerase
MKIYLLPYLALLLASCSNQMKNSKVDSDDNLVSLPSGLQYRVLKKGQGKGAISGDSVLIFETARYRDSTILYSNENSNRPIKVVIGAHQATDGEDEGLRGMKEGEIRDMIIPPKLSRRSTYPPNLSPDSTIIVKVILDKIL